MRDWISRYNGRIKTPRGALELIGSGDSIIASSASTPDVMIRTLAENKERFCGASVFNVLNLGDMPLAHREMRGHLRHSTIFATGSLRQAIRGGSSDYLPCHFHQLPALIGDTIPADVAILAVSAPDEQGYCSLSLGVDYAKKASQVAKILICEINDQLPYTYGSGLIHLDEMDCIVPVSYPPAQQPRPQIGAVERQIGQFCASLIQDGDTLQLGIGSIPDAVLLALTDKKDLGIHSEMFSDGVVDLIEAGVITNKHKKLHPGKSVATFLIGSERLYRYVDKNPAVEMHPVDYVNDPLVIRELDHIVAINSCLQADLSGQISAESIGPLHYSGTGGQVDFVRGAGMAAHGRSIIAMPSTGKNGTLSRIVPMLDPGTAVTTLRSDVHYIVTEYGVALLRGKTLRDRAGALIAVAHPDFRPDLIAEYERRFDQTYTAPC